MAVYRSNGSSWQQIASGDIYASTGSSWATVKRAYRSTGSSWDEVYVGSDEVTYYFVASASKGARGTSWKTNSNQGDSGDNPQYYPQIGKYVNGVYPWFGLVTFGNDTSGVSLADRLDERPVVKSAYFNVQRWNDGGFGNGYGNLYLGRYTGSFTATNPDYTKCNFTYSASKNWSGSGSPTTGSYTDNYLSRGEFVGGNPGSYNGVGWPEGGIELGEYRQQLVEHLETGAMCMAHTNNTGTSSSGLGHTGNVTYAQQANYWNFWRAGKTVFGVQIGPILTVTLDYV